MDRPRRATHLVNYKESTDDEVVHDELPVKRKQALSNGPVKKQRPNVLDLWQVTGVSETKALTRIASVLPKVLQCCVTQVAHFFLFCYERQMIWERRNKEEVFPYTESEVLQKYSFTNIYRELDRGTNYFRAHVLDLWDKHTKKDQIVMDHLAWIELVLWSSVCYRLVNRISTFETFGCIPEVSDWPMFHRFMSNSHSKDVTLFTNAHVVSGFRPFIESMKALYKENGKKVTQVSRELLKCCRNNDLEGCFQAVQTIKGAGPFIAWQVVCDLIESQCLKPCTENDWAELGPGAKAGIDMIFGNAKRHNFTNLDLAMLLQRIQDIVYEDIGITFPKWNGVPLTLKNIEHPLCEFFKYSVIHQKMSKNRKVMGQRLKKSRTALDLEKSCQCGNSDDVLFCDKCLNGFCQDCVTPSDSAYWVCPRCTKFEFISFGIETANRVEMKEPTLPAPLADVVDSSRLDVPTKDPDKIIGMTFLLESDVDGPPFRAKIKGRLDGTTNRYVVSIGDGGREQTMTHAALLDILSREHAEEVDDADRYWTFTSIVSHSKKKGKPWEVLVHWDDDSETWEPLSSIRAQDPATIAAYAKTYGLLETSGWKRFKSKLVREDQQLDE